MANMWRVNTETTQAVIADLSEQFQSRAAFALGGPEYAREVLEHLLGAERAEEIVGSLMAQAELRPFDFLRRTPPEQIVTFLSDEAPQTVALVVACLQTNLGARVLSELPVRAAGRGRPADRDDDRDATRGSSRTSSAGCGPSSPT